MSRNRTKPFRRPPHPIWQRVQSVIPPVMRTAGWLVGMALLVGGWTIWYLQRSPHFWVSAIEIQLAPGEAWVADPRIGYRLSPPVHILRADLQAVASAIHRDHPQLASVIVRRALPNRLVAHVALREPIGQLRGRQFYLTSTEGIILAPGSSTAWEGWPVLLVGSRTAAYQPGQSCGTEEFRQAVAVLQEVQRSKALGRHRASAVRVAPALPGSPDSRMVTVVLDTGLELRATPGDLTPRLARLGSLMQGRSREMEQAQYVDLRFDDLVIGLKGNE